MYQYNQGLQIFMVCTYLFVIFGSNKQCTVLRRRISAFIDNRKSIKGITKLVHRIKCICFDILSTWLYIRRCTELPEYFFFTLFFHFWPHHTMYSHGGCLSTCSSMIKKSWIVPNLGVIVFAHNRISRDILLWEMRFSYISRYTQYISRYTNMGKLSRGSGFQMIQISGHHVPISGVGKVPDVQRLYRVVLVRTGTSMYWFAQSCPGVLDSRCWSWFQMK